MNLEIVSAVVAQISAFASTAVHALLAWRYWRAAERKRPFALMVAQAAVLLVFAVGYVYIAARPDWQPYISTHLFRPALVLLFAVTALVSLATYEYHRSREGLLREKVTERERELTLQQMARQLAERERLMAEFQRNVINNLGHELRTPVSVILGYSAAILSGLYGELSDELRQPVNKIDLGGWRIQIISQRTVALLNDRFIPQEIDFESIIANILAHKRSLLAATRKQDGDISFSVDIQPAFIEGSYDSLRVAVFELIHNAVKFSISGGLISISVHPYNYNGGAVAVSVVDQGIGIDRKYHQRIFVPGFQIDMDEARRYEGTGTGLYVVEHVAEQHGGFVEVESEPGRGSTFRLVLPCK